MDKDQGEATVLEWPLKSVVVGEKYFYRNRGALLKAEKIRQNSQKK